MLHIIILQAYRNDKGCSVKGIIGFIWNLFMKEKRFFIKFLTYKLTKTHRQVFFFFLFPLEQTEQFTVLWILFATIVMGNSAVLITLYLNKRKSRMNFFIKQLAFAGKYLDLRFKLKNFCSSHSF